MREKVAIERFGRDEEEEDVEAAVAEEEGLLLLLLLEEEETTFFSGEKESARVAEGVLLCEDDGVPEPDELFVRREAERERRNVVPMSATEDEMLCRAECLRRGGEVCCC